MNIWLTSPCPRLPFSVLMTVMLAACATPNRLVYSSGFSFANYDYVFVAKPEGQNASTSLYGLDIEFGNLMSSYNMKVIGDKEYATFKPEEQKRTLFARMAVANNDERIVLSVSFDDATTGRTGSSITSTTKGELFEAEDRGEAFESVAKTLVKALSQDKGLVVSADNKSTP